MSIIKKNILILTILTVSNFCFSQEIKEVYIAFKLNLDTTEVKRNYYFKNSFYISGESFKIKENTCLKTINKNLLNELNVISISNFLENCKKEGMKYVFNPNELYQKIYIIEEYDSEKYILFEVEWKASYIN